MNLKLRLSLLLGLLLLAFLAALAALRLFEQRQRDDLLDRTRQHRIDVLNHWLETSGRSLHEFADSYAQWDELVHFLAKPDPAWAQAHLEADLPAFNAQALWVLRPDGGLIYSVNRLDDHALDPPPLAPVDFAALVGGGAHPHFFLESHAGLLEFRGAPVFGDASANRPVQGWLLVARRWDETH